MSDDQGIVRKPPVPGRKFIGVNFDGTLARDDGNYKGRSSLGEPIPVVLARVKDRIAQGDVVVLFTSRLADPTREDHGTVLAALHRWTETHVGERLFCTATKFPYLSEIWDWRAVFIPKNAGT